MRETFHVEAAVAVGTVRAALVETLATESHVVAAYLFGSLARGTAGPLSDIDVALLTGNPSEGEAACARTMDALCRRLRTSRVDIVSLADAPVPLRYRVIRDGLLVTCGDTAAVQRFVADTILQYLDFKPLRDRALALTRDAILQNA